MSKHFDKGTPHETFSWPADSGEVGALIRGHDWASTPLGRIETWPQSLMNLVDLILDSSVMMCLMWGRHAIMIYNQAYAVGIGARHPKALGTSAFDSFADVRHIFEPLFERAWAGETVVVRNLHNMFIRPDMPRHEGWYDLIYNRVRDDRGRVAGVLAIL